MDFNKTSEVVNSTFNQVYFRQFVFPILVLVLLVLIIILLIALLIKKDKTILLNTVDENLKMQSNNIEKNEKNEISDKISDKTFLIDFLFLVIVLCTIITLIFI